MPSNLIPKLHQILFLFALFTTVYAPYWASENTWYECSTDSNYTTNSTYHSNLNLLLPSLSSATLSTGFANLSKGQPPDQVFGLSLCRGDVTQDECQSCLSTADQGLLQLCPSGKSAAIWPTNCFLRFSNRSFSSSSSDDSSFRQILYNNGDVSEPTRFEKLLSELLNNLTERAAYQSARMFATGEAEFMTPTTLYGLVQCTRDQSGDDCFQCLTVSAGHISNNISGKPGAAVLAYNCLIRFEIYPFYNESIGAAPPPPPSTDTVSPPPEGSTPPGKEGGKPKRVMVISFLCASVILSAIFFCLWRRRKFLKLSNIEDDEIKGMKDLLFDLSTLRVATDNFSDMNKLGEGGFGPVYKGVLSDGQQIAVKRLSGRSRQGFQELRNEVMFVAKLEHRNLVKLLGCCLKEREKLLVYEFLPNTSLDNFLFDPTKRGLLEWGKRYKIIEGIARGLLYLHQESQIKIIHRDLKASNVLLDQYMNPKISDFGLAKLSDSEKTHGYASKIAGTNGYMAPEYAMQGHFSAKSDAFSFGVLILEIVTGRRIHDFRGSGCAANLLSYAWEHWSKGMALQIMDHSLGELYHRQEAMTCIHIGLLCVQEDLRRRPSMESVVLMLNNYSITLPTPSMPAYFVRSRAATDSSVTSRIANSGPSSSSSICNMSLTEMEPR